MNRTEALRLFREQATDADVLFALDPERQPASASQVFNRMMGDPDGAAVWIGYALETGKRLARLAAFGLTEKQDDGWHITPRGVEFSLAALDWAERKVPEPSNDEAHLRYQVAAQRFLGRAMSMASVSR